MSRSHPADLRDNKRIAKAVRFVVHFRRSPRDTFRAEAPTLAAARIEADRLNAAHGRHGRRAGIYAIGPDATVTFVPPEYQEP